MSKITSFFKITSLKYRKWLCAPFILNIYISFRSSLQHENSLQGMFMQRHFERMKIYYQYFIYLYDEPLCSEVLQNQTSSSLLQLHFVERIQCVDNEFTTGVNHYCDFHHPTVTHGINPVQWHWLCTVCTVYTAAAQHLSVYFSVLLIN